MTSMLDQIIGENYWEKLCFLIYVKQRYGIIQHMAIKMGIIYQIVSTLRKWCLIMLGSSLQIALVFLTSSCESETIKSYPMLTSLVSGINSCSPEVNMLHKELPLSWWFDSHKRASPGQYISLTIAWFWKQRWKIDECDYCCISFEWLYLLFWPDKICMYFWAVMFILLFGMKIWIEYYGLKF